MTFRSRFWLLLLALLHCHPAFAIQYTYDPLSRLTHVDYGNGQTIAYTYDAAGNRLSQVVIAPNTVNVTTSVAPAASGVTSGAGYKTIGESVTVTASPSTGYHFVNWAELGNVVSILPNYNFTAAVDRALAANFALDEVRSLALSSAAIAFGSLVGGSIKTITLSNTGTAVLNISNVGISGAFGQSNDCTSPLPPAAQCSFNVVFNPTGPGAYSGSLTIDSNALGSPHSISLSGTGDTLVQTITFAALPARVVGQLVNVSAIASSGLPVSFSSSPQAVCTVNGNTVTLASLGACTLTATQAGDATYKPAPNVAQTFQVTPNNDANTTTPIKHVIVVVGEEVSFDTLFGVYAPSNWQTINNLLSQGIVKKDGSPGPHYAKAVQWQGANNNGVYTLDPMRLSPYGALSQPKLMGVYDPSTLQSYSLAPDPRFAGITANGPFQITKFAGAGYLNATLTTGKPVQRFFQMWQQTGGSNDKPDLFAWVATTAGQGGDTDGVTAGNTGQGGELMGFFNMSKGDAPIFRQLAQQYALSDNTHQSVMGGAGANFMALATGDVAVYNTAGQLATPPGNQIENPDPTPNTENFYFRDGYSGGAYVNCSNPSAPGVAAILTLLDTRVRASQCEAGAYYLVNDYEPPYDILGNTRDSALNRYSPQYLPTIGSALTNKGVSWKWYTGGRDAADLTSDPLYSVYVGSFRQQLPPGTTEEAIATQAKEAVQAWQYNALGDPLNGFPAIAQSPLKENLKGLSTFHADIAAGSLPAVSFVVPKKMDFAHPGHAMWAYEQFLLDTYARMQDKPSLWANTAIIIIPASSGGYFDTGYIQNLDFFGNGPRIPLVVVSPYAKKGYVDHTYQDHTSILKFIERNWSLAPLSARSRDNLPNPGRSANDAYRPANEPAIGDLMSLFEWSHELRPSTSRPKRSFRFR
jgi:YD repeat-containing protein